MSKSEPAKTTVYGFGMMRVEFVVSCRRNGLNVYLGGVTLEQLNGLHEAELNSRIES